MNVMNRPLLVAVLLSGTAAIPAAFAQDDAAASCAELATLAEEQRSYLSEESLGNVELILERNRQEECATAIQQASAEIDYMRQQGTAGTGDAASAAEEAGATPSEPSDTAAAGAEGTEAATEGAEAGAAIVVSQPEPSVTVEQAAPQVSVSQPEPQVTVMQGQPEIIVRQAQPTIRLEMPQPVVTIEQPQPEIIIRMPEPQVAVTTPQPEVRVEQAEPVVRVEQAEPQVRVEQHEGEAQVQTEAAAAVVTTEESQGQAQVQVEQEQPIVHYESAEPIVEVQSAGEPQIQYTETGEAQVRFEAAGAEGAAAAAEGQDQAVQDAPDAASYVQQAAMGDLFEIRSSEMALDYSQNETVLDFANQMIEDHSALSERLQAAAGESGIEVEVPTELDQAHQQIITALEEAGNDFDRAYVRAQLQAHQQALALHQSYARGGDDEALRAVAGEAVPVIAQHYDHIRMVAQPFDEVADNPDQDAEAQPTEQ